jgi:hypothetical protein
MADEYGLSLPAQPSSIPGAAKQVYRLGLSSDFTAPGFCLLDLGPGVDSHALQACTGTTGTAGSCVTCYPAKSCTRVNEAINMVPCPASIDVAVAALGSRRRLRAGRDCGRGLVTPTRLTAGRTSVEGR